MRSLVKLAVLALVLCLAAAPRAGAASPPADVTGSYGGRLAFKFYPLVEGDSPEGGSVPASADVTMNETMVSLLVRVTTTDGDEVYNLQGRYGLGRFWATGSGPAGQMSVNGTVKGAAGKLKLAAVGSITSSDTLNTVKLSLKQLPPPL